MKAESTENAIDSDNEITKKQNWIDRRALLCHFEKYIELKVRTSAGIIINAVLLGSWNIAEALKKGIPNNS